MCITPTASIICFSFFTTFSILLMMSSTAPLARSGAPITPAAMTRMSVENMLFKPPRITILSTTATPVDSV